MGEQCPMTTGANQEHEVLDLGREEFFEAYNGRMLGPWLDREYDDADVGFGQEASSSFEERKGLVEIAHVVKALFANGILESL